MGKVKETLSKNRVVFIIILALIIIAAVVGIVIGVNKYNDNKKKEEEKKAIETAINNYMTAFNELDSTKMLESIDSKAAYAWSDCEGNLDEFKKAYDATSDEKIEEYNSDMSSQIEILKNFYGKYLDYYRVELSEITDYENVENIDGMKKVTAKTKTTYSYEGSEESSEEEVYFYIYNNKIVTMESVPEDNTEDTTNEMVTNEADINVISEDSEA